MLVHHQEARPYADCKTKPQPGKLTEVSPIACREGELSGALPPGNRGIVHDMKNRKLLRVVAISIAVIALAISAAVVLRARPSSAPVPESSTTPVAATVAVVRAPIANTLSIAGEFLPWQEVELHAKVAGYIKRINVDIGDRVHQGQTLAVLEVPELNAQVEGAAAGILHSRDEIQRAQNEVTRAEAAHASLHAAYERLHQAAQSRPGLIAEQELDNSFASDRTSDAQVDVAKSGLSAALQQLQVSKSAHQQVTAMQDYSRIVAPFDGTVTWRYADTGALIQSGTSNASSMPVVKVAQVNVLRLRVAVPESIAMGVRVGDTAQVNVQASGEKFPGKVARFTGSLDRSTRTMQVEIDLPNKDYRLSPGMFADVTLEVQNRPNALTVPVTAIRRTNAGSATVLIVGSSNRVEKRNVQIGIEDPNRAEIVAGVNEGERVIVGNLDAYQPGELVEPKPSRLSSANSASGGEDQ
jgi:RND family efflux transporter MFP subunit